MTHSRWVCSFYKTCATCDYSIFKLFFLAWNFSQFPRPESICKKTHHLNHAQNLNIHIRKYMYVNAHFLIIDSSWASSSYVLPAVITTKDELFLSCLSTACSSTPSTAAMSINLIDCQNRLQKEKVFCFPHP